MAAMSNKNNITKTMTQTRDTKRDAVVAFARKFALKWYYNNTAKATPTDVLNASLKEHSDVRVAHEGGAIGMTAMEVASITGHQFDVTVKDSTGSEGKPVNIVFIRVRYFVVTAGATVPAEPADFCKFIDRNKHPITLNLPATSAGLPIAISSCYVDAQGNEGLYCAVVNTHVS